MNETPQQYTRSAFWLCGRQGAFSSAGWNADKRDPQKSVEQFRVLQEGNLALPKSLEPEQWKHYGAWKNGASIVCIDPIRTRTAAASDWHLAPMSRMASSVNG